MDTTDSFSDFSSPEPDDSFKSQLQDALSQDGSFAFLLTPPTIDPSMALEPQHTQGPASSMSSSTVTTAAGPEIGSQFLEPLHQHRLSPTPSPQDDWLSHGDAPVSGTQTRSRDAPYADVLAGPSQTYGPLSPALQSSHTVSYTQGNSVPPRFYPAPPLSLAQRALQSLLLPTHVHPHQEASVHGANSPATQPPQAGTSSTAEQGPGFACPFGKSLLFAQTNPEQHRKCQATKIGDIDYCIVHLRRVHWYCFKCREQFDNKTLYDAHETDKADEHARYKRDYRPHADKWKSMWDDLCPGQVRPDTHYADYTTTAQDGAQALYLIAALHDDQKQSIRAMLEQNDVAGETSTPERQRLLTRLCGPAPAPSPWDNLPAQPGTVLQDSRVAPQSNAVAHTAAIQPSSWSAFPVYEGPFTPATASSQPSPNQFGGRNGPSRPRGRSSRGTSVHSMRQTSAASGHHTNAPTQPVPISFFNQPTTHDSIYSYQSAQRQFPVDISGIPAYTTGEGQGDFHRPNLSYRTTSASVHDQALPTHPGQVPSGPPRQYTGNPIYSTPGDLNYGSYYFNVSREDQSLANMPNYSHQASYNGRQGPHVGPEQIPRFVNMRDINPTSYGYEASMPSASPPNDPGHNYRKRYGSPSAVQQRPAKSNSSHRGQR